MYDMSLAVMRADAACCLEARLGYGQKSTPKRALLQLVCGAQAYISCLKLEGLALSSDMVYVTQVRAGCRHCVPSALLNPLGEEAFGQA